MYAAIELTPGERLLVRRQKETSEGLRVIVSDITDAAHHWPDKTVVLQAGTRLSAIFEFLKANASLREVHTRNWAQAYLDRYEALRSGEIIRAHLNDEADEPAIKALELSLRQELRIPNQLQSNIVAAHKIRIRQLQQTI